MVANPIVDLPRMRVHNGHVEILPVDRPRELMSYVTELKNGKYVRYFSLALFAGTRPGGELEKLADHPKLISLPNRTIRISPEISKTGKARQIKIQENLCQWLTRFAGEIFPINCDRELKAIRKKFALSRDVLRHTFCSAHVMAFGSFAETAIESGNSESIIRTHYFNSLTKSDAEAFWLIAPEQADSKVINLVG